MEKKILSSRGKLTLINSNSSSLPIYFMFLFKMPISVAKKIEKLQRQFFWSDSIEKKKIHLGSWETITKSQKYEGLGVKRMIEKNHALLAKWWYVEIDSLEKRSPYGLKWCAKNMAFHIKTGFLNYHLLVEHLSFGVISTQLGIQIVKWGT